MTPQTFAEGGPNLVVLARHGVGYDNVDVDSCTANDVAVCTTPEASRHPVASASFAYMIAPDHPLVQLGNVMLSPHTAAHTLELSVAMGNINCGQMLAAARGEVPPDIVNRGVVDRIGFQDKLRRWAGG